MLKMKIKVISATKQSGRMITNELLDYWVKSYNLIIIVRNSNKVNELTIKGIFVFRGFYDKFKSLLSAFQVVPQAFCKYQGWRWYY